MRSTAGQALTLVWRAASVTLLAYLACVLLASAAPVVMAWLTKLVLDGLVLDGLVTGRPLTPLAAGLAAAALTGALVQQAGQYLRAELDRRAGLSARAELFAAVGRWRGLARFEDPVMLDRLRLAEQSAATPGRVVDALFGLGRGMVTLAGFVASLLVISPAFTAVVIVSALPALLAELRLSRRRARVLWEVGPAERRELFYGNLLGSVDGAKEIRLFGLGGFLRGRMIAERRAVDAAKRAMDRRELAAQGALAALSALTAGAGLIWAVGSGLSVGDVSMFIAAVAGIQGAIEGLVGSTGQAHQQLLMFGHYTAVRRAEPDLPSPDAGGPPPLRRGIELRDVWFRYSEDHPWVLRGVSLFIPHGRAVALVGLNGAGKSTLVKLLCRFYDPQRGAILWDGVDLRDLPADGLRARIGAVFQDFMAYDFSAADNIAVGDLAVLGRTAPVEEAARRAGVHDALARLPRGYDTPLTRMFFGENDDGDPETGVPLSGGQWQRVALARAFLRGDRDLMILDEPSAGLDPDAEYEVHSRLREIRAGRTSVLISHRLGSIRAADLIAVLVDGRVGEMGRHDELLARAGSYARLWARQASGYVDAESVP
ncbi:ABC transporter ATP-binding protein [Nonomuraea sp. NPDC005650]|uniref:ABC transporter ATP-binding protein n=1 Tax=Nonomuraea sp. NPDC005650 TaxID=3157045 RepID=UPI0033A9C841